MLQALKLQGKRPKTIEAYSRGVRRVAGFYQRCPDTLSAAELKTYFASLLDTHSWSTIKLGRNGLQSQRNRNNPPRASLALKSPICQGIGHPVGCILVLTRLDALWAGP